MTKDMLDLARHIVNQKAGRFEPEKFEDHYETALIDLNRKRAGKPITPKERPAPTNVVDLIEALRRSVGREAAPMKAALEAWGAGSNFFHQGVANETDDPAVVAATMSKPGVVLKRPAGSNGRFAEHSDLPADMGARRQLASAGKTSAEAGEASRSQDQRTRSPESCGRL